MAHGPGKSQRSEAARFQWALGNLSSASGSVLPSEGPCGPAAVGARLCAGCGRGGGGSRRAHGPVPRRVHAPGHLCPEQPFSEAAEAVGGDCQAPREIIFPLC